MDDVNKGKYLYTPERSCFLWVAMASYAGGSMGGAGSDLGRPQTLPLNPDFQPKKKKQRVKSSSLCLAAPFVLVLKITYGH